MPGTWEKASPRGSDPRSLSGRGTGCLQQAEPHRHPSLLLGVRGGFCLQEQLECLTAKARVRVQRGLPRGSVFRPDPVGPVLAQKTAGTMPARARWALPDNCSQNWGSSLVFTKVSS